MRRGRKTLRERGFTDTEIVERRLKQVREAVARVRVRQRKEGKIKAGAVGRPRKYTPDEAKNKQKVRYLTKAYGYEFTIKEAAEFKNLDTQIKKLDWLGQHKASYITKLAKMLGLD